MTKNKGGRPTVMTPLVLKKLEECFSLGLSDVKSCNLAGISTPTLYEYEKRNPKFTCRKVQLKDDLILKAVETIKKDLHDPKTAQWYLERKLKSEFSTRTEVSNEIQIKKVFITKEEKLETVSHIEETISD